MPLTTQALYFHLSLRADDEGFVNNPKKIMRFIGCSEDDMRILLSKRFLLSFESGVIVIKHWKLHNTIRKDRLKLTVYQEEKSLLAEKENGSYTFKDEIPLIEEVTTNCQPTDNQLSDECPHRLDKIRLDKDSIDKNSVGKKNSRFTPPTLEEVQQYCIDRNNKVDAQRFIDFYESKGWMIGKNKMKSWKACVRTWENKDEKNRKSNPKNRFTNYDQGEKVDYNALANQNQFGGK